APGASFTYRFRPPDPGTSLVRPLVLGRSGEPAGRGLAGLLVVEEREPVPVDAEYALVVRDWRLEPSGALAPFGDPREAALAGRLGHRLAVDGGDAPKRIEAAPGSRIRIRLANACNARILRLRFDDLRVFVTGVDGQPADKFEPLRSSLPFPPGSRYDIVLDLPRSPGAKGAITALVGDGLPLVALGTTDAPARPERPPIAAPAPNPLLPAEIKLQAALRRDVLILGGASRGPDGQLTFPGPGKPIWSVNGEPGSAAAPPLLQAKRGQPVVLGITNRTGFPQPLHLHGHVARLLHPLDDGWEPYWMDTFQVPEGKTVHIAFVADNPGRWLLGSTVLERLDAGLWTSFEVT
ncbi:MAG: multicopper oxidase family protein, partial [Methylobacteriaceae bacterium]|nr:multicopper oxidase family protein [Methylobacteriaceae bacterium]